MTHLPPPVMVPSTPSIAATDINDLYAININDLKGTGAFSRVVTATNRKNGEHRALKVMERQGLVGKKAAMVLHEKEILRRTNHPSIIRLHQFIQTPHQVFFELDLMTTDLFEYIMIHKRLNEQDTALIMQQLLSAVAYLHNTDVIHRDIKPENILINSPSDIKLADFGLAKVVEGWAVRNTPCGTSYYIAPEVIRSIEMQGATPLTTTREDVKAVDIWSCGITMFVLLAGRPPFNGQVKTSEERKTLLRRIDRGVLFGDDRWAAIEEEAKDLILRLLDQNINHRITAEQALKHPFFAKRGLKMISGLDNVTAAAPIPAAPVNSHSDVQMSPLVTSGNVAASNSAMANEANKAAEGHNSNGKADDALRQELAQMQTDLLAVGDEQGGDTDYKSTATVAQAVTSNPKVVQKKVLLPGQKKQ